MSVVLSTLKLVLKDPRYATLTVLVASFVFVLATWLPNLGLIWQIVSSSSIALSDKLGFLFSLVGSIQTNFTLFSASYTIIIAILFGINVALVTYYFKRRKKFLEQGGMITSMGGLVTGVFGIGCAACGTFILTPLLAVVGAGSLIAFLPFGGEEFGILSVGILGLSVFLTSKKIQDPLTCNIEEPKT